MVSSAIKSWLLFLCLFIPGVYAAHAQTRVSGYVGIIHPIVTVSKEGSHFNFDGSYTVGMPAGINLWKTDKSGFSFEIVPFVRTEQGISKANNLLFHPGYLQALGHGYTFVIRAAFETSGRFGCTPLINKVVIKGKNAGLFTALTAPCRVGNDLPASAAIAFQFGVSF